MKRIFLLTGFGFLIACHITAQDYHAVQGSSYAGSLGVHNNPASIVSTPYKWDLTLLGMQMQNSTNAVTIYDYAYLSSPAVSKYYLSGGQYPRYAKIDLNLNLFNARIALSRKQAIAFGVNLQSHTNLNTSTYNYYDTLHASGDFFSMNQNNNNFSLSMTTSTWVELYGSYSRTVYEDEQGRLNLGATVKVSRGLSGAYVKLSGAQFATSTQGNTPTYTLSNASLVYGYSSNFDQWQKGNSTGQNLNNFFALSQGGASFDFGAEYLVKPQEVTNFGDDDNYFDYTWKFGVSLLDVGANQYKYGTQSRNISGVKANITNTALDTAFSKVSSLATFNDSLATLVNQSSAIAGQFKTINPMRLVLNVDHFLTGAFYINADLSINIPVSFLKNYLQVKELNFITITPRWETKKLGFYLPVQFNTENQFWVGAAIKAGPLLIGVHNVANLFSNASTQNGGGYIALVIHSSTFTGKKADKRLDCPADSRARAVR